MQRQTQTHGSCNEDTRWDIWPSQVGVRKGIRKQAESQWWANISPEKREGMSLYRNHKQPQVANEHLRSGSWRQERRLPVEFRFQIMGMCLVLTYLQRLNSQKRERERGRAFRGRVPDGGTYGAGANGGCWAWNENRVIGTGPSPTSLA